MVLYKPRTWCPFCPINDAVSVDEKIRDDPSFDKKGDSQFGAVKCREKVYADRNDTTVQRIDSTEQSVFGPETITVSRCSESIQIGTIRLKKIEVGHPLRIDGDFRICDGQSSNCSFEDVTNMRFIKNMQKKKEKAFSWRIAVIYENGQIFQHFGHTETFKRFTM